MFMTEEMAANVPSVMYQAYAYALRIESSVPSKSAECSHNKRATGAAREVAVLSCARITHSILFHNSTRSPRCREIKSKKISDD